MSTFIPQQQKRPYGKNAKTDAAKLKKIRSDLGLREIKSGKRACLKCDRNFLSQDLANNKMCDNCRTAKG